MIAETVEHLLMCPYLEGCGIKVNYLDEKPFACSLKMLSVDHVVKKYCDGGILGEARFLLSLRQEYTAANSVNKEAALRCEKIEGWIEEQNKKGIYPRLRSGKIALGLSVEKSFEITSTGGIDARFEAELRLLFYGC